MNAASDRTEALSREEEFTFLFAQLVLQQSNMAMMLLGRVPHPENGKVIQDVEAARLFIDQLEMLEAKTKGNLTKEEEALLKQNLMNLRLSFVQAVESPAPSAADKTTAKETAFETPKPAEAPHPTAGTEPAGQDDEHRKKFSKKY